MKIKVEALHRYPGNDMSVTLYVDGDKVQTKSIYSQTEFIVPYSDSDQHNVVVKISGDYESKYANKANNELSYTLPSGLFAQIQLGYWYSNIETEIQGAIKNANIDLSPTLHGFLDRLLFAVSSIPLYGWFIVALALIGVVYFIKSRKKTVYVAGKKPNVFKRIWNRLRGKKPEVYEKGDIELKIRRF